MSLATLSWRTIHVYFYNENKDGVILDAVRPALARLADKVERAFFVRHWRRGPHLRIPVLATADTFRLVVEPTVTEVIGGYLARHPSTALLPPEDVLLPIHERLAKLEQESGPLRPFVPDNSVLYEGHDRRLHVMGGEAGSDLLAEFYTSTNELAFRMLEEIRNGASREVLGLSLMLAVAHCYYGDPPSIRFGMVSFRSHADAFLYGSSDCNGIQASFDRQYQRNKEVLVRLVHRVLNTLDARSGEVPFASEWVRAVRPFWIRSERLIRSGQLRLSVGRPEDGDENSGHVRPSDPMHQLMSENDAFRRLILDNPQFISYRLMLNFTYLHLARLGIMGYARYRLCHLAANAVEDALGIKALEIVRSFVTMFPNTPALANEGG